MLPPSRIVAIGDAADGRGDFVGSTEEILGLAFGVGCFVSPCFKSSEIGIGASATDADAGSNALGEAEEMRGEDCWSEASGRGDCLLSLPIR